MRGALAGAVSCSGADAGSYAEAAITGTTDSPTSLDPPEPDETTPTTGSPGTGSTSETTDATTGTTGTTVGGICGDGFVGPGEACDDGPDNDPYATCTDDCQWNVCGDGKVRLGVEQCDEGSANVDTGYCRSDCMLGVCGDGFVLSGLEECDDGDANSDNYGACDPACTVNRCGDGMLDVPFEQCDDGPDNGTGGEEDGVVGCDIDCGFAGRILFLSSQSFTGDTNSRAGADVACQHMAKAANFKRSERFRALLADAYGSPNTYVLPDAAGRPFIAPGGLVLAADYASLIDAGPGKGVTLTETGEMLLGTKVWTNVGPFGDAYSVDPASTCSNWNSEEFVQSARVGINAVDADAFALWQAERQWLSADTRPCFWDYRIYCIEAE